MLRIEVFVIYAVSTTVPHLACSIHTNWGSSLADRPPREDIPLPTSPPYTAFIGNLAFDVTESEMAAFFGGHEVRRESLAQPQTGHLDCCFADKIHQNHQGQR